MTIDVPAALRSPCHARTPERSYDGPSLLVRVGVLDLSVSCADDQRVVRGRSACHARTISVSMRGRSRSCADDQRVMRGRSACHARTVEAIICIQHNRWPTAPDPPGLLPDSPRTPPEERGEGGREGSIRIITNSLWNGLCWRRNLLHFHRAATRHARLAPVGGAARRAPDDRRHGAAGHLRLRDTAPKGW